MRAHNVVAVCVHTRRRVACVRAHVRAVLRLSQVASMLGKMNLAGLKPQLYPDAKAVDKLATEAVRPMLQHMLC